MGEAKHRVLYVSSDAETRRTLAAYLDGTTDIGVRAVSNGPKALAALDDSVDWLVADLPIAGPSWSGFHKAVPPRIPTILFTDPDPTAVLDDGTVVWANSPFETVFPGAEQSPAGEFYERLLAMLADQPTLASSIRSLRDSEQVREGELLPVSPDTGGRRDVVHCSYQLPSRTDATRL
jgi:hypothetical protein